MNPKKQGGQILQPPQLSPIKVASHTDVNYKMQDCQRFPVNEKLALLIWTTFHGSNGAKTFGV